MKPSQVLRVYMWAAFGSGALLACVFGWLVRTGEIEPTAGILLVLAYNVFLMLILPLVLDASERKYCKARFVELEELARDNPELKAYLEQQCTRLAVPQIRIAVVDTTTDGPFSYGLWRYNPRLIVPASVLEQKTPEMLIPSIELELDRFARQEVSLMFFICGAVQVLIEQIIIWAQF